MNSLFEAKLKKKSVKPDNRTDLDTRSNFIYDKYQHRKWYSADGATKKKRVSAFVPPAPIGETTSAEEDDFFDLINKECQCVKMCFNNFCTLDIVDHIYSVRELDKSEKELL